MENSVLDCASTGLDVGRKVAIATIVETWGPAPQSEMTRALRLGFS